MEGTVSQIFYLGLSLNFMKSRKIFIKNNKNLRVFCHKMKTKTYIKILRHSSLQMNVFDIP